VHQNVTPVTSRQMRSNDTLVVQGCDEELGYVIMHCLPDTRRQIERTGTFK
jgi:hypothetical protein